MGRLLVLGERVQELVNAKLSPMVLQLGSVNAVCQLLNDALSAAGSDGRIYPNRLHALLSDDPARGLNESTLSQVERAVDGVDLATLGAKFGDGQSSARIEEIKLRWSKSRRTLDVVQDLATQLQLPPAIVRHVLSDEGLLSRMTPGMLSRGLHASPAMFAGASPKTMPDWSFQETAIRKCSESLAKGVGRKVGMIVPTGGGKTRIALLIALMHLKADPGTGKVVWVTHRVNLRHQANRELQKVIAEGPLPLPGDAAQLLAKRIEFIMVGQLEDRLDQADDITLLIVDEAHHAAAPSYQPIFELGRSIPMLALTATPNRTDGLPIGIDEIAFHITYRELVEKGVIVMPEFEDFPVDDFDWSEKDIANLADFVVEEAKDRFRKTLVIAPRISRVEEFYTALANHLAKDPEHPLSLDDVGFLHSERNSMEATSEEFLATFSAKPRAIVVSAQMLLEGFDDPQLNAVIVTYPSSSLVLLMQAAGRCVRAAVGKTKAFVVQARNDEIAYHFEQRWLYQEISDYLRPELLDVSYRNADHLRARIEELLDARRVIPEMREKVLEQLNTVQPGQTCRLLLFGLPYTGRQEDFSACASWGCFLETEGNSDAFRFIFNQFCSFGAELNDVESFLTAAGRNYGLRKELEGITDWFLYSHILVSMRFAKKEVYGVSKGGRWLAKSRPYARNRPTTWLTYGTFHYEPSVPPELDAFLQDCYNREEILSQYTASPNQWGCAIKIPVPMGGMEAHVLDASQSRWFRAAVEDLNEALKSVPPRERHGVFTSWVARTESVPVAMRILTRFDWFLPEEIHGQCVLSLNSPSENSEQTVEPETVDTENPKERDR